MQQDSESREAQIKRMWEDLQKPDRERLELLDELMGDNSLTEQPKQLLLGYTSLGMRLDDVARQRGSISPVQRQDCIADAVISDGL